MYATTDLDQERAWLAKAASGSGWSADDLGPGLGGQIPPIPPEIDTPYFRDALADPQSRPYVIDILNASDPVKAFDDQSEKDLSEAVHPTGAVVVFKALVAPIAERLHKVNAAIAAALPTSNTDEGRLAIHIANNVPDAKGELEDYYTHIAFEAFDPGAYDQVTGDMGPLFTPGPEPKGLFGYDSHVAQAMGELGLSKKWKKRLRRIKKVGEVVGVAVAAVAATVVTGGAAMGAIAAAAGVAGTALKTFGHTKRQKRIGGYLQTGAAVAGAAAAAVGAANAISNAVSGPSAPAAPSAPAPAPEVAPAPPPAAGDSSTLVTSFDQSAPAEPVPGMVTSLDQGPPAQPVPGIVTSLDQGAPAQPVPGIVTSFDQTAPEGAPSVSQAPSAPSPSGATSAPGGGAGSAQSILQAAGATAGAAGSIIGAGEQAGVFGPASTTTVTPQTTSSLVQGAITSMWPFLLGGVVLFAMSQSSKRPRRNPAYRRRWRGR